MTTERPEIIVEGSDDGVSWKPYRFRWKPCELDRRPRFTTPHMPRLDWQMWFAALAGDCRSSPGSSGSSSGCWRGRRRCWGCCGKTRFPTARRVMCAHACIYTRLLGGAHGTGGPARIGGCSARR